VAHPALVEAAVIGSLTTGGAGPRSLPSCSAPIRSVTLQTSSLLPEGERIPRWQLPALVLHLRVPSSSQVQEDDPSEQYSGVSL